MIEYCEKETTRTFSNKDISFASRDRYKNFDQGVTTWFCTNRQLISNMATLAIGIGAKVGVGILFKAVPAVMGRVTKKVKYNFQKFQFYFWNKKNHDFYENNRKLILQKEEKQKQQEELAMMGGNLLGLAVGAATSRRPPAQEGHGQQY